jgi:putative nucleotidyltransferase with HDIG domain
MTDQALLQELDTLVRETYLLWEPGWVTFNWREYTYDHVQRVRALALTLATREHANAEVVELAALLHDVTKSYDGEYVTDANGQRIVDANGQWHNHLRPPVASNEATALFDELHLAGTLHNVSGAAVARTLLARRGVAPNTCERAAVAIADHLSPPADARIESLCLYDADTIDANIGLPAFVRNIYIHLHFYEQREASAGSLDELLVNEPLTYLGPYVREKLRPWAEGKLRDLCPRLRTAAGRELAETRLRRLEATFSQLEAELQTLATSLQHGGLAVLLHYMRHRDRASIAAKTRSLVHDCAVRNGAARTLIEAIDRECRGLE